MNHNKNLRSAFMLLLRTSIFGVSIVLFFSTSVFAQCARPGFKLTHGFVEGSVTAGRTATGDFNSDGKLDVAITNQDASTVSTLFGDGLGKLGPATWYVVGLAEIHDIIVADINNDAKADIVVIGHDSQSNRSVSVLLNNGTGVFGSAITTTIGFVLLHVQIGDMNGDNKPDLVIYTKVSGIRSFQVRLGNGTGQFAAPINNVLHDVDNFLLGHLNSDTLLDFVAVIYVPPSNYILRQYLNNGVGGFSIGGSTDLGSHHVGLAAARDFNGDGKLDVVGSNGLTDTISVLLNDGSGGFSRTDYPSLDSRLLLGDFDGNGTSDFLSSDVVGPGTWPYIGYTTSIHLNNGIGVFSRTDHKALPVYEYGIVADFNNDGKSDLLTPAYAHPFLEWISQVMINTCNYSLSTKHSDFDGDGVTDFSVWRPSTGEWIIRETGGGLLRTQQWGLGSLGDIPVPGDYDGDGKSDLAIFRAPSGDWWVYRSSDSTALGVHWGASGDKPVPGDYDADGKTDFAVFRPSDGGWFILRSSDSTMVVAFFGMTGDKPVQADYDNDDKIDVAVYRPSTGFWYILKSSDGSFNFTHFGISSDKPIPADYDGDGKADIAVFRPGEGWYFLNSGTLGFRGAVWHQDMVPAPGSYGQQRGIINISSWDSENGSFHVFADSVRYSVGGNGDIPVTTPYVIE